MRVQFDLFNFIKAYPIFFVKIDGAVAKIKNLVFRPIGTSNAFVTENVLGVKIVFSVKTKTLVI